MRLTAELVEHAGQRLNPLMEREIILRGYKIPAIENTGALRDAFDCVDLSDNEIRRVGNFAKLPRLKMLLLNNNAVSQIDPALGTQLPNLRTLVLSGNKIDRLSEVDFFSSCRTLESLSLLDNPICRSPHYRPYVIAKSPDSLKVLDFRKIKNIERTEAAKLFPKDGPAAVDVTKPAPPPPRARPPGGPVAASGGNNMTPAPPPPLALPNGAASGLSAALRHLTESQKAAVRAAVAAAKTPRELDDLERRLRAGLLPTIPVAPTPPTAPPPPHALANNKNGNVQAAADDGAPSAPVPLTQEGVPVQAPVEGGPVPGPPPPGPPGPPASSSTSSRPPPADARPTADDDGDAAMDTTPDDAPAPRGVPPGVPPPPPNGGPSDGHPPTGPEADGHQNATTVAGAGSTLVKETNNDAAAAAAEEASLTGRRRDGHVPPT